MKSPLRDFWIHQEEETKSFDAYDTKEEAMECLQHYGGIVIHVREVSEVKIAEYIIP